MDGVFRGSNLISERRISKTPVWKKLFCLIVLLILVGGLLFFLLRQNAPPENTKNPIFEQHLSSAKKIQSIVLEYESNLTITSNSTTTVIEISGKIFRKGNNEFDEAAVKVGDVVTNVRTYIFGDEVYVCPRVEGEWRCSRVETITSLSSEACLRTIETIYEKGAMVFEPVGDQRTIDGKTCSQLRINVDVSKLSRQEKLFILAISGLSTVKEPDKYAEMIEGFSMNIWVADGVELESEYALDLGKTATYRMRTVMRSYEINVEIPDFLFILSCEPKISGGEIEYVMEGKTYRGAYFPEHENALRWIRENTPENARFFAWWDYGHEIMGCAKRDVFVFSPSKEILWSVAGGWDENVNGPLSPHEKIISVAHGFLTESFGELRSEMEKCGAQYIFITSNYLGELKVMLKIGQELGGINPEEYFADGNPTQKAKRTTLYTLWNKPPGYEEIIRPLVLVYEDSYVKIYRLGD
jgi:hypothetical protein